MTAAKRPPLPSTIPTERTRVRVVTLTTALVQPWALTFLPEGDLLITERAGRLRLMHDGHLASEPIGASMFARIIETRLPAGAHA